MQECNTNTKLNILHICDYEGSYDDLTRFISYPGQIVNAPIEVNGKPFSLKDCERLFKRPAMGGLYRKGTILEGTTEQVINEVNVLKHDLGGDCTILPKTPMDNVRAAIQTSHHTHE